MVFTGITMAILASIFVDSGYGLQAQNAAQAAATAGAQDAYLQLIRNNTFSSGGGYTVTAGSSSALVTVNQNTPSTGLATVVSVATVLNRTRKIQAVFSVNAVTGQISLVSWVNQ